MNYTLAPILKLIDTDRQVGNVGSSIKPGNDGGSELTCQHRILPASAPKGESRRLLFQELGRSWIYNAFYEHVMAQHQETVTIGRIGRVTNLHRDARQGTRVAILGPEGILIDAVQDMSHGIDGKGNGSSEHCVGLSWVSVLEL